MMTKQSLETLDASSFHPDVVQALHWKPQSEVESSESQCEPFTIVICTYKRSDAVKRFLESLLEHETKPAKLLFVDASPDELTEKVVLDQTRPSQLCGSLLYLRVGGILKGLTRQRNYALTLLDTKSVIFFDDDIVLHPGALRELSEAMRLNPDAVGIGAFCVNERAKPTKFWRLREKLKIVSDLKPGGYSRSGFSIPWGFLENPERFVEGKWLKGCSMMWRTSLAKSVRFNDDFAGYSSGEDLDFSLRMMRHGKLIMATRAEVLHLPENSGRPNAYQLGYMSLKNAHDIQRRCLADRTWVDELRFIYAFGFDTAMRMVNVVTPGDRGQRIRFLAGRMRYFRECFFQHIGGKKTDSPAV